MTKNYQLYCCGSRGSRPVEGIRFNEFGGFTTCYVLKEDDYALVIDCGTGLYEANAILLDCTKIDVVLTHMHYDHVLGLLGWDRLNSKAKITYYSNFDKWNGDKTFEDLFRKPFWPVQPTFDIKQTPAIGQKLILRDDLSVEFYDAPHPNNSQRMIIRHIDDEKNEHRIVIMFDNENSSGIEYELVKDADYLIYDGMYTDAEFSSKSGFGHSTWQEGVRFASRVNCKRLIITHHSPERIDDELRNFESKARDIFPATDFARSGQHWDFPNIEKKTIINEEKPNNKIVKLINDINEQVNSILLDDEKLSRFVSIGCIAILGIVSVFMTIVNLITQKQSLMYSTLIFAICCFANLAIELVNKKYHKIAMGLFQIEMFALFIFFIVSGTPEGFSAIWILMLPVAGTLVFGTKRTAALSLLMLFILLFFFDTELGRSYLQYEYTESFMLRFPMAFIAFLLIGLFLSSAREKLRKELDRIRGSQAKTIANQTAELRAQYFDILSSNSKLQLRNRVLQEMLGEDISDEKIREMLPKDENMRGE